MENMNERIKELLTDNRELLGNAIAIDGVVDEQRYLSSKIRTMFLLKEVNYPSMNKDWLFIEAVKQTANDSSSWNWPNICLWMEALLHPESSYTDCTEANGTPKKEKLLQHLLEIGLVNIKKTPGGSSSNDEEIWDAVSHYGELVRQEIEEIIRPQIVICGGTFQYAKKIIREAEPKMLPAGTMYFIHNQIFYLQFVHPSWFSVNRNILFAYAKAVFNDVQTIMHAEKAHE